MLITPSEYKEVLNTYYFTDCVVRDRTMFTFVASRYYTDEEVAEEEREWLDPLMRDKRVIPFFVHREPEKRWKWALIEGWSSIGGGASLHPKNQFVGIDTGSHVYATGSGEGGVEDDIPRFKDGGPDRGTLHRLKTIGGYAYACGLGRSVAKRLGKNSWFSHTQSIPDPDVNGEDSGGRKGFKDIDGFNEQDIYAVGGKGDVWHFDGATWKQCAFPTNESTQSVCCGADGNVYISCYEGLTFVGRGDKWKKIHGGGITLGFKDMVWYEDRVWCTGDYGIWTIHNEKVSEPELDSEVRACAGNMYVNDGVLLIAGLGGAAFKEGGKWQTIVLRAEMEQQVRKSAK